MQSFSSLALMDSTHLSVQNNRLAQMNARVWDVVHACCSDSRGIFATDLLDQTLNLRFFLIELLAEQTSVKFSAIKFQT